MPRVAGFGSWINLVTNRWHLTDKGKTCLTSDLDIYRTANLLIEQHDDEAPIPRGHAGGRAA